MKVTLVLSKGCEPAFKTQCTWPQSKEMKLNALEVKIRSRLKPEVRSRVKPPRVQ